MSKKLTKEDYVSKAIAIHGNKYDYSKLIYKGIFNKVQIICPIHGKFSKIAHYHTNKKQGCPKCGMERSKANQALTKESFIKKAKAIHGEKYDYSQVQYSNAKTKVKIFCSIDNPSISIPPKTFSFALATLHHNKPRTKIPKSFFISKRYQKL